jgi:hypothetical protein
MYGFNVCRIYAESFSKKQIAWLLIALLAETESSSPKKQHILLTVGGSRFGAVREGHCIIYCVCVRAYVYVCI